MIIFVVVPSNVYAQTSGIIQLDVDQEHHHGTVSIKNIQVDEKEFYKVIHLDIQIKVIDLGLENSASIDPNAIELVNERGKAYLPTNADCTVPDGGAAGDSRPCFQAENDCGKPVWFFLIYGTKGGIGEYHPCFRVEKEFNNFTVNYGYMKLDHYYETTQVGYEPIMKISLNEKNDPTNNIFSNANNINTTKSNDFFTQLLDMIKNWFKLI